MNTETKPDESGASSARVILTSVAVATLILALAASPDPHRAGASSLEDSVVPPSGVVLPITWGDLGAELVAAGVIDQEKLSALYEDRGGLPAEYRRLLEMGVQEKIVMTKENAGYLLNLFWALGLANKNPILEDRTEMMNPAYGGAGNFASTGGWTIAKGDAMEHYNRHSLIPLTVEQQALVDRVSRGIYRPCCGNSVHFPDCNHGMAMLGLLELMASQGVGEEDLYKTALFVNSYWFPDTYMTIAAYMKSKGVAWKDISPKEMLGVNYSSAEGYARIAAQVSQSQQQGGGNGCGVSAGEPARATATAGRVRSLSYPQPRLTYRA